MKYLILLSLLLVLVNFSLSFRDVSSRHQVHSFSESPEYFRTESYPSYYRPNQKPHYQQFREECESLGYKLSPRYSYASSFGITGNFKFIIGGCLLVLLTRLRCL